MVRGRQGETIGNPRLLARLRPTLSYSEAHRAREKRQKLFSECETWIKARTIARG